MEWTNYHHLLYFYTAVKMGGVGKAAQSLHVSQPTVSKLITTLENEIGATLWIKSGRGHKLTESGEIVFQYAEEIFSLGTEMRETLKGGTSQLDREFIIGLHQALPKLLAARIIALLMGEHVGIKLKCIEGSLNTLLSSLNEHKIDAIISDAPAQTEKAGSGFYHLLLQSKIGLYASAILTKKFKQNFPDNLKEIPLILPTYPSALRTAFNDWCLVNSIKTNIVAECDDSGLMKALGAEGLGAFIAPIIMDKEILVQFKVKNIGVFPKIQESIWLISPARKIIHPILKDIMKIKRSLSPALGFLS